MKKTLSLIFVFCGLILLAGVFLLMPNAGNFAHMESPPSQIKITSNSANVYTEASEYSQIIANFPLGTVLQVENIAGEFYEISFADENTEKRGFVLKAFTRDNSISVQKVFLNTNAKITSQTFAYEFKNNSYVQSGVILEKETRVQLLNGFDHRQQFSLVSAEIAGEVKTFYVETLLLDPDGLNQRTLIAIMIIIACVSVFLILYSFVRGRKKKKI